MSADQHRAAADYLHRLTALAEAVQDAQAAVDEACRNPPPGVLQADIAAAVRVTPRGLRKRLARHDA